MKIGNISVGPGHPVYIIGEIGLNHNGDVGIAKRLIDVASLAGCQAVKFQKRTPDTCVPEEHKNLMRETPWGLMTYLEYRHRVEFGESEYAEIDAYCKSKGIDWFCSPWDAESVRFLERFNPSCYKVASACLTDLELLRELRACGRPVILSTGMSTLEEIDTAVEALDRGRLMLMHTTSSYPAASYELNLRVIPELADRYSLPVGYSGHEKGLQASYAAVALGACSVERHITLDRTMWGSDQAASLEPSGLIRLVRDIRVVEQALGDGVKRVYDSEKPILAKLRRVKTAAL